MSFDRIIWITISVSMLNIVTHEEWLCGHDNKSRMIYCGQPDIIFMITYRIKWVLLNVSENLLRKDKDNLAG